MEKYKNIYLLVITILFIALLFDKCTTEPCGEGVVVSSKIDMDSVRTHYEVYSDSSIAWVHNNYSEVPELKPDGTKVEYVFIHNDLNEDMMDLSDTSVFNTEIDTFYYGKKDSSLHYNIRVFSEVKPERLEMEYDIKELSIRDSVYVRDSINVKQTDKVRVNQVYMGAESIIYPGFKGVFLGGDFVSKHGWQTEVSIGVAQFSGNATAMIKVGFKKLITFKKK